MAPFDSTIPRWHVALVAELRDPQGRPPDRERPPQLAERLRALLESSDRATFVAAPSAEGSTHVQALLWRARLGSEVVARLCDEVHPFRWIFGIGFGEVEVERGASGPISLGGSALDRARAALWQARRDRVGAVAQGFGSPDDAVIESHLELMDQIRARWTARQAETVRAARGAKGKDIAERFGVSPSVVSESLKAASFRPLLRAEAALAELLDRFGTDAPRIAGEVAYPELTEPIPRESQRVATRN